MRAARLPVSTASGLALLRTVWWTLLGSAVLSISAIAALARLGYAPAVMPGAAGAVGGAALLALGTGVVLLGRHRAAREALRRGPPPASYPTALLGFALGEGVAWAGFVHYLLSGSQTTGLALGAAALALLVAYRP